MTTILTPKLLAADAVVLGSPVYFNNVTAQLKAFMDRTWAIKGALTNKIGAAVVVGRRYGAESAITAMNAFFLKHEMLIANRGVSGIAFQSEEIQEDDEALESATRLASRLLALGDRLGLAVKAPRRADRNAGNHEEGAPHE
jgi:multimeric flavodoxin WrbA